MPIKGIGKLCQICWNIWKERCNAAFKKHKPDPEAVIRRAAIAIAEGIQLWEDNQQEQLKRRWIINGKKPDAGWVKFNVDGAFDVNSGAAGFGILARDDDGRLIDGIGRTIDTQNAFLAEAMALKEGLKLGRKLRCEKVIMETDSIMLYNAVKEKGSQRFGSIFS
ncbi:hypothetical protein COLO4_20835 [Corchorus olitorius]|uniref:RNase H type-1 domain-containing protein n=1 Tax=Corchorus olitorius TaxID=93759 RepID=A0A1R3IWM6_9ROSI|nr:hypothetical protein COLO4_20835 [Corchorus olitorius]